ncbi:MAG: ABC transporter permease [Nitrospirae bacterium]|nr:ABC transporter permease [Nitrospirota bacterium]
MFADTYYLFAKYMRITWRMPMWTLFGLAQPLIWLIIFSDLFSGMAKLQGWPTTSYANFFLPGVMVMTVLFGSAWAGVSLLREINLGAIDKMMVTPIHRGAVLLSRVTHAAATVILQCLVLIGVAYVMGLDLNGSPLKIGAGLVAVWTLGIGFAALSNGIAIVIRREEPLVIVGNFMTLPLMFFSSAMMPVIYMPEWIQVLAVVNPINYAVEAARTMLVGSGDWVVFGKGFGIVLAFTIATFTWANMTFMKSRK